MTNRSLKLRTSLVFVFGFGTAICWQEIKSRIYFRPVQHLMTPDRAHSAVLERAESLDLNFRIKLDSQEIYRSPDFNPDPSLAFLETLLWDVTGKYLLFEVAGRRLFGYDVSGQRPLSNVELLRAKATQPSSRALGFEGEWPDEK